MASRATALLISVACLAGTGAQAAQPTGTMEIARLLQAAGAKAEAGDCVSAMATIDPLLLSPGFAAMPDVGKQAGYGMAALCDMTLKKTDSAYRHAVAATSLGVTMTDVWRIRLGLEIQKKDSAAAVTTVEAMAPGHQDAINAIPMQWFFALDRMLKDKPDIAGRRRLLAVLSSPAYVPETIGLQSDQFRAYYAALLVDAGDKAAAAPIVAQIKDPFALVGISVDPRLAATLPPGFDARAAFEDALTRSRDLAASHPGSLNVLLQIGRMLLAVGRPGEALATLEANRPDADHFGGFDDIDEARNWWWDGMASSYIMLGRYDDGVAAFGHGVAAGERGQLNVSQTINLAGVQIRSGHERDALATMAMFDKPEAKTSPYGAMQMHQVRGCARFRTGDVAGARQDLAYAVAHERDAAKATTLLQLCMNDMDAAAASTIRQLAAPEERVDTLLMLSDFDPPLPTIPKDPIDAKVDALKARSDVAAAILRAGGVRRFRLQSYAF